MNAFATIAGAGYRHNQRPARPLSRTIGRGRWLLVFSAVVLGCTISKPPLAEVPVWQLARAEPVDVCYLGRARLSHDRPLPSHLTQRLCDEFSLITITEQDDWADLRRRLRLERAPLALDLSQGVIVGLLASVGESASGIWPIRIESVRADSGEGWLEATFAPGCYYPVLTADYLELVYVPGLRAVRRAEIGPRAFMIRSRYTSH